MNNYVIQVLEDDADFELCWDFELSFKLTENNLETHFRYTRKADHSSQSIGFEMNPELPITDPTDPTDPTSLFTLIEIFPNGAPNYQHSKYPWNTLYAEINSQTTTIYVKFPPQRRYKNGGIDDIDIRRALEDDILFANRYFLDHPEHPERQFLKITTYAVREFYNDFKQTFQTPLTRAGYLPEKLLRDDWSDAEIIQAYLNPDARTTNNYDLFLYKQDYQKISPEQLTALNAAKPRTALMYLYYGDQADQYLYAQSKRPKTTMAFLEGVQKKENKNALRLSIVSEKPLTIYAPSSPPELLSGSTSGTTTGTTSTPNGTPLRNGDSTRFIPIIRYASGMRRGLYFADDTANPNTQFCGTFYYYEPDSNFFLSVDWYRYLVFDNKYSAVRWLSYILGPEFSANPGTPLVIDPQIASLLKSSETPGNLYSVLAQKVATIYPPTRNNLVEQVNRNIQMFRLSLSLFIPEMATDPNLMTPQYIADLETNANINLLDLFMMGIPIKTPDGKDLFLTSNDYLLPNGHYVDYLSRFYAQEDRFDQPLCQMAFLLGFNVVILTKMVGSTRVVSEVLDTRDREDSFKAIYEIIG